MIIIKTFLQHSLRTTIRQPPFKLTINPIINFSTITNNKKLKDLHQ